MYVLFRVGSSFALFELTFKDRGAAMDFSAPFYNAYLIFLERVLYSKSLMTHHLSCHISLRVG